MIHRYQIAASPKQIKLAGLAIFLVISCAEDGAVDSPESKPSPFEDSGFVGSPVDSQSGDVDVAADKTGPVLTLLAPESGEVVSGTTTVHVLADDPSGVALMRVAANANPLEDSHPDPGVFLGKWNTATYPNGEHKLLLLAKDTVGNETWQTIPVVVENDVGSVVAGNVNVGSPVNQATVKVHELSSKGLGKLLGQGKTDETGRFSIITGFDSDSGWALVTVTGPAWYQHPDTGETLQMIADDKLTAALKLAPGSFSETEVNAWTTIATRLMEGLSGQGASFSNQWPVAVQWVSEHLQRPDSFDLHEVPPLFPNELLFTSELTPEAVVGLTQWALWRIAEEEESDIFDAAKKLGADLATDAQFDGDGRYEDQNDVSTLLWNSGLPLNTEVTRYRLAEAVAELVLQQEAEHDNWPDALRYEMLNKPLGLLDTLAYDVGPLYPPQDKAPPSYFDNDAPVVTFVDPTPPEGTWVGANDTLTLVAVAKDKSPLMEFSWWLVPDEKPPETWKVGLTDDKLSAEIPGVVLPKGEVTVKATAIDTSKQTLKGSAIRTFLVDLDPPKINEVWPKNDPPIATEVVDLEVFATDGESGVAQVVIQPQDCGPGCTSEILIYDETTASWKGKVVLWQEGPQNYLIVAEDNAGNTQTKVHTMVRDTLPPVVTPLASLYVPAWSMALTDGTTAQSAVWQPFEDTVNLMKVCNLTDAGSATHTCNVPLSIFIHESTCNPQSPKLIFDIEDAHLTAITSHFDYGHLENETVVSKKTGTLPTTPKGILEVPLCADTLGAAFQTPGAQHQVAIWVTDSAGNPSKPITVQFTVAWETPPLWVGPSQAPLDKWDLASYSFDDFTIHKPFATQANDGSSMYGYRMLRYELINPHSIAIDVKLSAVGEVTLEQGIQRAYLYMSEFPWKPVHCEKYKCSYWYAPYPGEQWFSSQGACGSEANFNTLFWTEISLTRNVWLTVPKQAPKSAKAGDTFTIPPQSKALVSWTMNSMDTCFVAPPFGYTIATINAAFYQFSTKSCADYGNAADGNSVVPFSVQDQWGIAICTAKVGAGGYGVNFYLPLTLKSLRTRIATPKSALPILLNLSYGASSANSKVVVATHPNDVLWSDTAANSSLLKPKPYYNLPKP